MLEQESGLRTPVVVCPATSRLNLKEVLERNEADFKGKLGHIPIPVSLRLSTDTKPVYRWQMTCAVFSAGGGGPLAGQWEAQGRGVVTFSVGRDRPLPTSWVRKWIKSEKKSIFQGY